MIIDHVKLTPFVEASSVFRVPPSLSLVDLYKQTFLLFPLEESFLGGGISVYCICPYSRARDLVTEKPVDLVTGCREIGTQSPAV